MSTGSNSDHTGTFSTKNDCISLIVLSHGLWGVKSHMSFIEKKLKEKYGNKAYILNSSVNEGKYSYDGIDICGIRLAKDVQSTISQLEKNGKTITRISFIGYSLGGLITRYAIGYLGRRGLFKKIQPHYYTSFATPHMSVKLPKSTLFSALFNVISGKIVSRTGEQLQLLDGDMFQQRTLLETLSDPNDIYYKYLSQFKVLRCYANIANDRTVPYWTAAMESKDFFFNKKGKLDITLDEKYMSVITDFDLKSHENYISSNDQKKRRKEKSLKPVVQKYVLLCILPLLAPFLYLWGLSFIAVQGLISRYRTAQLLKEHQQPSLLTAASHLNIRNDAIEHKVETVQNDSRKDNSIETAGRKIEGDLLTGALDAVNLANNVDPTEEPHTQVDDFVEYDSEAEEADDYYLVKKAYQHHINVQPSTALEKVSRALPLEKPTQRICHNLQKLPWERVYVYIKAFNAHGSIVCRQKRFTMDGGIATVQHFIDTTQLA
ncbi:putative serine esterase-domain-containing protein [Mycotypha africana]|uniref:putative serine esterase-domain-containing protein n=1 Tax=Mycotypha africana TaxID=64632 RepID=UPI0023012A26|nr:putative serine esterase-domain-containing protein [Mycotypha africana]KAI8991140.1 putative serine esterase-domain-containing protein [Mycotypha africana]